MPLYIPWLTETIKKRGVRYLLHHYLGQFFEEKLTLEQLSIDIYEGKGSIRNLALDVVGLNDELDFIPFTFLEGCLIGQISVEVPWSSLATDACKVELDGAKFYCRLKTSADASKTHCTESTLLSRSLMTSSMQMAEDIVTTEDDDDNDPSLINHHNAWTGGKGQGSGPTSAKQKDANQMFEGLEMFAQLIDSVLRRIKLTARNTLFQIKPHCDHDDDDDNGERNDGTDSNSARGPTKKHSVSSKSSADEFSEPVAKSDTESEDDSDAQDDDNPEQDHGNNSERTVEFFIKFFRCEEMIDQAAQDNNSFTANKSDGDTTEANKSLCALPETITKILTLEDVEMRIDGIPVSNLVGKHTITIKFNGQKSEISIFSSSPLLATISHKQLETFFNVFDGTREPDMDSSFAAEKDQKLMSPEDYAKIENQLLETASTRNIHTSDLRTGGLGGIGGGSTLTSNTTGSYYGRGQVGSATRGAGRWLESSELYSDLGQPPLVGPDGSNFRYQGSGSSGTLKSGDNMDQSGREHTIEPTLDHIEAFSCELKLPGIWLCILRDGETLPPLIKPHADSINSFQSINKYIDANIKIPHIRFLALKVALDITATGINIFLGDLDISEHLMDSTRISPVVRLLNNDLANNAMNSSRYKASIVNGRDITVDLLTKTRIVFDPTIIDRIIYDYQLIKVDTGQQAQSSKSSSTKARHHSNHKHHPSGTRAVANQAPSQQRATSADFNLTIRGEQSKIELLCPIPDLTPEAQSRRTQLRPQSFIFDFKSFSVTWQSDKLKISSDELAAFVKTRPMQSDAEAVKFIEASGRLNDKIELIIEPSPSNLDSDFTQDIEQALNESSMYESIYVSQATESKIPTEAFQTKRKVVRASFQNQETPATSGSHRPDGAKISECDHEKIITPGERQHLLNYLNQTMASTKLSFNLHLPVCEVEFEDKQQLDLIYNRFGNDFVFWQPRAFTRSQQHADGGGARRKSKSSRDGLEFKRPANIDDDTSGEEPSSDADNEASDVSLNSMSQARGGEEDPTSDFHNNEVTCKIVVDELFVKFNHQSCAATKKQEISADNFLMGVVIDVNGKPSTLLSLVADNLELSTDLETVLEGNSFGAKNSIFALTAEIKRPTKALKDIKLAIQLKDGLLNDFRTETYTRFWQSVNVTDEPIVGYVAPQIVTELHIDILNTCLLVIKEGARPALLAMDELYVTSMVMAETSQVMIRLIADEMSLYMKRDRQGLEVMKNYICLIDSGLIDLDVKFGGDGERLEFGVINNVISVRVCQDSLSALCRLFNMLIKDSNKKQQQESESASSPAPPSVPVSRVQESSEKLCQQQQQRVGGPPARRVDGNQPLGVTTTTDDGSEQQHRGREMDLLVDAMNDYTLSSSSVERRNDMHRQGRGPGAFDGARNSLEDEEEDDEVHGEDDEEKSEASDDSGEGRDKSDGCRRRRRRHHKAISADSSGDDNERSSRSSEQEDSADDDDDEGEEEDDYDSDAPPAFQRASSGSISNGSQRGSGSSGGSASRDPKRRDPNACLLDESNPVLGDLFSAPLLPMTEQQPDSPVSQATSGEPNFAAGADQNMDGLEDRGSSSPVPRCMDESGFFVIGDDDVGAGIIDKKQHEPVVRKLIDGPISIVENHFKMTRPRMLPDALLNSLERYVLEEMTLVVNLFGGHDFDDETSDDEAAASNDDASSFTKVTTSSAAKSAAGSANQAFETTNEPLDTIGGVKSQSIRSRASSVAATGRQLSTGSSDAGAPSSRSPKRSRLASVGASGSGVESGRGRRKKHLSESSGLRADHLGKGVEQRVRFGEGAVNLWESLDLMSSPDFLGARSGPNQPALSSETKQAGGTWRQNDVCIQLTLSKVKLLYELADGSGGNEMSCQAAAAAAAPAVAQPGPSSNTTPTLAGTSAALAWRFILFIQNIEVKDRVAASDINKLLYEYCNESLPKRSTQMLTIKNIATINPSDGCVECDLSVSLKPLRLNIDQDTLLFLIEFFTTFCKSLTKQQSIYLRQYQQQQQQQQQWNTSSGSLGGGGEQAGCAATDRPGGGRKSMASSEANPAANLSGRCETGKEGLQSAASRRRDGVTRSERAHENCLGAARAGAHLTDGASSGGAPYNHARARADSLSSTASSDSTDIASAAGSLSARAGTATTTAAGKYARKSLGAETEEDAAQRRLSSASSSASSFESSSAELGAEESASGSVAGRTRASQRGGAKSIQTEASQITRADSAPDDGLGGASSLPTHCHTDKMSGAPDHQQPIYIKSFAFSPDVPIRIDYHAKHLDFEQGALAGILMGLAHLDHSELILRRVHAKHGMRGLDRVLVFAINFWLSDIKRNQLPSILGGIGPMYSVIQLFQGMRDLIWMPIDHYRKDGRLVRGLQRGASSFSSSTAMAAINLVNRFISIVQCTAQIAHDIVTPPSMAGGGSSRPGEHQRRRRTRAHKGHPAGQSSSGGLAGGSSSSRRLYHQARASALSSNADAAATLHLGGMPSAGAPAGVGGGLNQPRNFCEGVAVGFTILKEGFNDTARNVTVGMQAEDMRSAVGELVRQIPSTLLNPIISATEGAQSVLVGIRNQIAPDARREDQEKWKGRVRGK